MEIFILNVYDDGDVSTVGAYSTIEKAKTAALLIDIPHSAWKEESDDYQVAIVDDDYSFGIARVVLDA